MKKIQSKSLHRAFSLIEISIVIVIIGILIAGITQGSRLVKSSKLSSARSLTKGSDVISIKNLSMWLEPTLEDAFTNSANSNEVGDGDTIKSWNNYNPQSIYNTEYNATQNSPGSQPLYITDGINGLPSLRYDKTVLKGLNIGTSE